MLDHDATTAARDAARQERIKHGKPWDEFIAEWSTQKPDADALKYFGHWPDGAAEQTLVRI